MKFIDFEMIYQWPLKKQMIIFGLIFLVTFYAGYHWDILTQQEKLSEAQQQEIDSKQQISMVLTKEATITNEISHISTIQKTLAQWKNKLLLHSELPDILNDILKIGANKHIYFVSFSPGDEVKEGGYTKIPIKVIVVGSYHQIGEFISDVSNMPKIVTARGFTISNENKADILGDRLAQQANSENLLTMEMVLEIYFLPEKPT